MAETDGRVDKLEERIRSLEMTRQVVIVVAVFFGLSGAYLVSRLNDAKSRVEQLKVDIAKQESDVARARDNAISAVRAAAPSALQAELARVGGLLVKAGDQVWLKARGGPYIGVADGNVGPVNSGDRAPGRGKGQDERFTIEK